MLSVETSTGRLFIEKLGSGKEIFLFFHGFGQSHQDMLPFKNLIKPDQKFLFIDLFYHGKSSWSNSSLVMTKSDWKETIEQILSLEKCTQFHLVGYSMGGKFSLLTYELFPTQVLSLTLLAPDGIKTGLFYNLNSYPHFIHGLFKRVVVQPHRFFTIMNGLHALGIMEPSLIKFVKTQMKTRTKRAQVYFSWKTFGRIQLSVSKIIEQAKKEKTPIKLFTGRFDKMVTTKNLHRFSKQIPHIQTISLPVGHGKLIEAVVEYLKGDSDFRKLEN
jgi:pimeloyl-ACP methyl ester carboxylesterase